MTVGQVRMSILLTQTAPGVTKISFRSKPASGGLPLPLGEGRGEGTQHSAPSTQHWFGVNQLASTFGGGGHIHAAGARVQMEIDQAKAAVINALL
jgi:hypothetical protein